MSGPRGASVADLMQTEVATIGPDAPVPELARRLLEHGVSGMPVVDDRGRVVGLVSSTDILWHADELSVSARAEAWREGRPWTALAERTVADIMTADIFGLAADDSLDDVLRFLARTGLHRVPVLEGKRLLGMISVTDLLPLLAGEEEAVAEPGSR